MTTDENRRTLQPRDKGWSWVIMMSGFGVHFVSVGFLRSYGLLFVAFQEKYGYSASLASVVNLAINVSYCVLCLLTMNIFLKKFSARTCIVTGICLQSVGLAICNLVPNTAYLIVCLGVCYGSGHGLLYMPCLYTVAEYFFQHRSLAMIFATTGASVGAFCYPMITRALLRNYGLQGALLIMSGLTFQQLVFATVLTPPSDYGYAEEEQVFEEEEVAEGKRVV